MTFDEAIRYDGRMKIITTEGICKIGYIKMVDHDNESILFKAADDEYTFSKSEMASIERVQIITETFLKLNCLIDMKGWCFV